MIFFYNLMYLQKNKILRNKTNRIKENFIIICFSFHSKGFFVRFEYIILLIIVEIYFYNC